MKTFAIATTSALLLAAALASTTALAQGNERGIKRMDTNQDGMIDKTEAAARPKLAERFDAIDTNKDGKLAPDELRAAKPKRGASGHAPATAPERTQ